MQASPNQNRSVAVLGATGQLGSALVECWDAGVALLTPSRAELDAEDGAAVRAFLKRTTPAVLINCTAFHNVPECEQRPDRAFAVNALAVDAMAAACAATGTAFVTVSTDYVFDGRGVRPYRTTDPARPVNAYGVSKLAGELLVPRHRGLRWMIVRTSGVYGKSGTSNKGYTFIERVLRDAEEGRPVRVVTDMTFSPSYAPHIAASMRTLIENGDWGLHHVAGSGSCTWYEFAQYAFDLLDLGTIEPTTTAAFASPVQRPLYSPLENDRVAEGESAAPPPWRQGIEEFVAQRASREIRR